jgi:hypothetical protein
MEKEGSIECMVQIVVEHKFHRANFVSCTTEEVGLVGLKMVAAFENNRWRNGNWV